MRWDLLLMGTGILLFFSFVGWVLVQEHRLVSCEINCELTYDGNRKQLKACLKDCVRND